jgi:hypothetical protein
MKVGALAVLLAASPAFAGPQQYGWLIETDTVPDGAIELTTSVFDRDNVGPFHQRATGLVWTPAIGLSHCLELAFPVEIDTITEDDAAPFGGVGRYGAELRYRFLRDIAGLRPLARFALSHDVQLDTQVRGEVELAVSYDIDRVQIAGDVGGVVDVNFGHLHEELHPSFGASVRTAERLRLGGELHAELSHDATVPSWVAIGPDLAWSRGRFWLAGAFGFGIYQATIAPRLNLGMVW